MKTYINAIFLGLTLLLLNACEKEMTPIGLDLLDQSTLLNAHFTDTATITAISVYHDSLETDAMPSNVIGFLNDPIFGGSTATVYTQYALNVNNVQFAENAVVDSVILTIRLLDAYGDTLTPIPINVYEITQDLQKDVPYYETTAFEKKTENLVENPSAGVLAKPKTYVMLDTSKVDPHLRIKLKNSFGEYFVENQSYLTDNETFKSFFKGLAIECTGNSSGVGALLNCNFVTSISGITIYLHDETGTDKCSFINGNTEIRSNVYTHDYLRAAYALKHQVLAGDPSTTDEVLFTQSNAGIRTKIQFPNLVDMFKDQKVIINKAELVITNIDDNKPFTAPTSLTLEGVTTADGNITLLPDHGAVTGNSALFGGFYDDKKDEYRFRITRYIQDLVNGKNVLEDYIYLMPNSYSNIPTRLMFAGTNPADDDQRLRLEITYSKY